MILIEDYFGTYCPVKVLCNFLAVRPLALGPLFIDFLSRPIKRVRVVYMIKRCISLCGLDPSEFNTHSFRVGRATDLALIGTSDHVIRETGRWKTNAFLRYIRLEKFVLP